MGYYVVSKLIKKMKTKNIQIQGSKILIMGLTFKENCPDIRNSGIKNVITKLKNFKCKLNLFDPYVDREEIKQMYDIYPNLKLSKNRYDAVLIAVAHNKFKTIGLSKIKDLCKKKHVIFDLKNLFNSNRADLKL
jgi:UDP-N-acetyl-D-galactosamine dehydrogenase